MKKGFIIFLLAFISLGLFACVKTIEMPTYEWTDESITFQHPAEYNILGEGSTIFVTKSTSMMPPAGEVMFELMLTSTEATLEESKVIYESYSEHTETPLYIGEKDVTMIEYVAELVPDYTYTVLLLETEKGTLSLIPGLGHEDLAEIVVKSLVLQ